MVWFKRLFSLLAIGFLAYFGWQSRELLAEIIAGASILHLLAATGAWAVMHLLSPLFTVSVFRGSGFDLGFNTAARIHLSNLPARYIPGGIWHTVGRIVALRQLGIDARRISLFVLLENSLAVAVAFLLGGGVLYLYRGLEGWGGLAAAGAAGGAAMLFVMPLVIRHRVFGDMESVTKGHYFVYVCVVALSWCVGSFSFVLFVSAFPAFMPGTALLETAAAYLFSWGVGFLAVFAPQGIGVFEVMAGELLRGSIALGGVAALLAGFRVVIFTADLFAWMLGRLLVPQGDR